MTTWPEYIKDHIEHKLWRNEKLGRTLTIIKHEVGLNVLDSLKLGDLIDRSSTDCDCHTLGHDMKILFETELLIYCEDNADDLQDMFPEEWQDYKDENGIADNQYPCGKHTGDEQ